MKRVIFNLVKQPDTNLIQYPDDMTLFSNTSITEDGTQIIADYTGDIVLDEYTDPSTTCVSRLAFMELFTQTELEAIYTTAKTDVTVEVFVEKMKACSVLCLGHPDVVNAINYLESIAVIDSVKAQEILSS